MGGMIHKEKFHKFDRDGRESGRISMITGIDPVSKQLIFLIVQNIYHRDNPNNVNCQERES